MAGMDVLESYGLEGQANNSETQLVLETNSIKTRVLHELYLIIAHGILRAAQPKPTFMTPHCGYDFRMTKAPYP